MAILFLVRHAQASFGTEHYDRLSELGRQQARWLGEYFAERELRFARVYAGTLVRQRDTATEITTTLGLHDAEVATHAGLDEYPGEALYAAFTGGADPRAHQVGDYRGYWRTLRQAMDAWAEDKLTGMPESWSQFGARMQDALAIAADGLGRNDHALVISSGGSIGRVIAEIVGAPHRMAIEFNLQFRNTAFCELIVAGGTTRMLSFNAIPHLDVPARRPAITFT